MPQVTSSSRPFGAVLTAMVTPMREDGSVDVDAGVRLARWLVDRGNDGLVLNGTTGEAPTTHAPEKADLVRAVVDAVGDRAFVVAGAGSNDTAHAVRMAEQAAVAGAHGLLVVSPYYSRPSQEGLARHMEAVADSTDLPVMLYDIPGRAGVRIAPDTMARLAEHPRVVAVKDATGDPVGAARGILRTSLAWYSGDDTLYLPMLSLGAVGIVSVAAHVAAPAFAQLTRAWDTGDHAGALAAFRSMLPAIDALNGAGMQAAAAKAGCQLLGLLDSRATRLPVTPYTDAEVSVVRDGLVRAGLLAPVV
ncbi:4-hydroxy-tetrahydrodipicolinate synthase [Cellulomonas citrea]|uniref:4-hydroxy-tetrahydrodipicolinate synthase n=1 Tax=Cellulomonas citrea TaxID=1909423 RepID=UPI00135BDBC4|nr:4-hydroxy-tetrahydrodipicolinate synthase [Cellulomonas citrea]